MKLLKIIFVVSCLVLISTLSYATVRDVACSGDITAAVQSAINSSVDTDTVNIGAGTCSAGTVSWSNKNIIITGQGAASTTISGIRFSITISTAGGSKANFQIGNFSITGSYTNSILNINNSNPNLSTWAGYFRIHNLTISTTTDGTNMFIIYGPVWGLFDHLNITKNYGGNIFEFCDYLNSECNHGEANPAALLGEYSARTLPIGLGTATAIYIEDSVFDWNASAGSGAVLDSESGGQRTVFRYNTLTGPNYLYAHWTRVAGWCAGEWDGHKYEIYNNSFNGENAIAYPMRFESGTGVIFNNTVKNYTSPSVIVNERRGSGYESGEPIGDCDGTEAWDGNNGDTNAPGWPCAGQIGYACIAGNCERNAMDSVPLILWNNGTQDGCSTGGACTNSLAVYVQHLGGARQTSNYIKSTAHTSTGSLNGAIDYSDGNAAMPETVGIYTNSYTSYTYPHPLQGEPPDITTPVISNGLPSGSQACSPGPTANVTLSITCTDAVGCTACKACLEAAGCTTGTDIDAAAMDITLVQSGTTWSYTNEGQTCNTASRNYFVKCEDAANNETAATTIAYSIAAQVPTGGSWGKSVHVGGKKMRVGNKELQVQ